MLEVSFLSPLSIQLDDQPIKLASRRTEALMVYLIRNPQPHARDHLATLFWDDVPQKKAQGNLRVLLSNLRKELAPYFTITRQTAAFNPDSLYQFDSRVVEDALEIARTEMAQEQMLSIATATKLGDILTTYSGALLPGFHLRNGFGFEEWLATEREWLWTRVVEALEDLTTAALHWGDYRMGIVQAQRLVHLDPLREEGHQQLMQLWAADGQIGAALEQYERCVKILDEELGAPPHPFTIELQARMRNGTWQLPSAPSNAIIQALPTIKHNLPRQMHPLIGREEELIQLLRLLADPARPLVTIFGQGGIGKTILAVEAARHFIDSVEGGQPHFQDGIYHVSLAPITDAATIPTAIANALGYRIQQDGGDEQTQLLHFLRNRSVLLLLDNAEHLLDETELFDELLIAAPEVKLLVTSRHKLSLQGETIVPLEGLSYPADDGAILIAQAGARQLSETLMEYSAIELFVENVQRDHGRVELSDDDMKSVAHICRLTQGMPLAILLAASWVEYLSPAEIATEILQNVAFLSESGNAHAGQSVDGQQATNDGDSLSMRHQSMAAIFNHSWDLLTAVEQKIFTRMSIFRGGCTRSVAQQVTGGSLRELLSLVHKSLITRDISSGRFSVHELLRQMAAERLIEMGQAAAPLHQAAVETMERLYAEELTPHYGELAEHAEEAGLLDKASHYFSLAGREARDLYQNNLALELYGRALALVPVDEHTVSYELCMERQSLMHILGRREDEARELATLKDLADKLDDRYKQSEVFVNWARYAEACGEYAEAAKMAEAAVALAGEKQADALLAQGNLAGGIALGRENKFDKAEERLQAAVHHATRAKLPLIAADSLRNLGIGAAYQNNYEAANEYFEQNLQIYRELGDQQGEAVGLGNLAVLALRYSDYAGAKPYLEESMSLFRLFGDLRREAIGQNNLGIVAHKLGNHEDAEQHFAQALLIARQTQDRQTEREAHSLSGHLSADQLQWENAQAHHTAALTIAEVLAVPVHIVEATVSLAAIALANGNKVHAAELLDSVIADINESVLAQAEDALRVIWSAYRILAASQDDRAHKMLERAFNLLQQKAAQISNESLQHSFLQDSPIHREIAAAFETQRIR